MAQTTEDTKVTPQQTSGPGQAAPKPTAAPVPPKPAVAPAKPAAPVPTPAVKPAGPAYVHMRVKRGFQINEGGKILIGGQSFLSTPERAKQLAHVADVVGDATPSVVTSGAPTAPVK